LNTLSLPVAVAVVTTEVVEVVLEGFVLVLLIQYRREQHTQ
jgi:multisubunit Na+/H+ antiporter MnhC subunit